MKKYGTFLHVLLTALVGFIFFIVGELYLKFLLPFIAAFVWQPLGIAIYFLLFALAIYGVSLLLNKWRGDYDGWQKQNLTSTVASNYKKAAIVLAIVFVATCLFEFLYEIDGKISFSKSSSSSSFIFCIDDSGSMGWNDPEMKRVEAISDIVEDNKKTDFAVYRFHHEVEKIRDMGPYKKGEEFAFNPEGGTDIVLALKCVVDDIKSGELKAGKSPKILLLSDGESEEYGLDEVIEDCKDLNVVVSTVGFGVTSPMLERIATETGGTYSAVELTNIANLGNEMKAAITSTNNRNLLSDRNSLGIDPIRLVMRIVFLILLGLAFSWMKQKCYSSAYDHAYEDKVFLVSAILSGVASVWIEVMFLLIPNFPFFIFDIAHSGIRLVFCVLWAIFPGFFVKEQPNYSQQQQYF